MVGGPNRYPILSISTLGTSFGVVGATESIMPFVVRHSESVFIRFASAKSSGL